MRILITGANGQLGRELQVALAAYDVEAFGHSDLDVAEAGDVARVLAGARPDVVIHTAALTDTTRCEREPELAMQVNAVGSENVARACAAAGASMVYVSTNEVFDGTKQTPYLENDATGPLNEYGRSKLEGERRVQRELANYFIVRTSWLYGAGGSNFIAKVLGWAESQRLTGVTDEISTPTWTRDLAAAIARLIETEQFGVYHFANAGAASRYDWVREILRLKGLDAEVEPISTAQFLESLPGGTVMSRKPAYSVLRNHSGAALGIELRPWRETLAEYMSTLS
jgi:dTDP-4-dehydrorhamnose reductase